ncbi:omega-hydroxy-beta-dihydromenaquinone-9 sulfotransferase Stf3-like [Oscarella lobularis]|uniref:omega-hydroxy-beta-dihydromenaquinone-9 sulfotransferase Stf3-like n=1 Tax=Oscarella lobularis TaxID=121494 RepID=UPI0033142B38
MGVAVFVSSLLLSLFRILLNAIDPYLSRINVHLVAKPPSSVEELLATIRAESGFLPSLAQNSQWRERLQLALDSVRTADDLTPFGRWILYGTLRMEINSLQCSETIAQKFPEVVIAPRPDRTNRPVFIFGLWRSGTTLLHYLLSLYPDAFSPSVSQVVFGGASPSDVRDASSLDDLRHKIKMASKRHSIETEAFLRAVLSLSYSVHPIDVDRPEECIEVLNRYLFYETLPLVLCDDFMDVVSQYEELSDRAYCLYKRDLHVIQSIFCPNDRRRSHFVLKAPHHTPFSDVILRHFPDACFVRMHRNPADVVASFTSLLCRNNASFSRVDSLKLGRSMQRTVFRMTNELVRQTPRMPESTIDVRFDDFIRDPISVCRKIAVEVGMEHTKAVDDKLTAFLIEDKAKRARAGKHVYAIEDFGLDSAEIRRDSKEYCDMFSV